MVKGRERTTPHLACSPIQRGSALVVVLLVMTALSVLGVLSMHSSLIEQQLVQNSNEGKKIFYLSESAF